MKERVVSRSQPQAAWRAAVLAGPVLLLVWLAGAAVAVPAAEKTQKKEYRVVTESRNEDPGDMPYLGVTMQELDEHLRKGLDVKVKTGVLVSQVMEGSPAEKGGIEDGDIIVEFNGKRVDSPEGLKELVGGTPTGETVKVKVVRDREPRTLTVTIGERPEDESLSFRAPENFIWLDQGKNWFKGAFGQGRLGVQATDLNGDLAPYFGVKEGGGALVLEVVEGSVAENMGVKSGDVIVKVKDEDIGSVKDLVGAVGKLEGGEKFDVTLLRSKKSMTLQGEAGEGLETSYRKALRAVPEVRVPKMKIEKLHGMSDAEMDKLRGEMNELKKEMEQLKEELENIKESS
jgi:serine protease Do